MLYLNGPVARVQRIRDAGSMASKKREFDVVVWGATGFTGRLVAEYLCKHYGVGKDLRWAIGGRNQGKLEGLREGLGTVAAELPILLGDSADAPFLRSLAERTSVVCSTVGPYAKYGSDLVEACVTTGTSYCDLTGELQWIRRMMDRHQAAAAESGARIVHSCGFDCIPSDIGVFFLQSEMHARHGVPCSRIKYRVKAFSGGFSGGTAASMLEMMSELQSDAAVRKLMADPYALNPEGKRQGPDGADQVGPVFDDDFNSWTGPFVMAALNTRVVRRSAALLEELYGSDFRYDEAVLMGPGPLAAVKAAGMAAGLGGVLVAGAIGPLRRLLARALPKPGEGPSAKQREEGYFDIQLLGEHPRDKEKNLRAKVYGDRDPGYGSTAKMLGESAVCLALDSLEVEGGFWTTAAAMGEPLLARLNERAGVTFTLDG